MAKAKKFIKLLMGTKKVKTATCPICKTRYDIYDDSDYVRAQKCLTVCSHLKFDSLPKFARFKDDKIASTVFRLEKIDESLTFNDWGGQPKDPYLYYHVDNGAWGVEPYIKNGKIYSKHYKDYLDGKEMVATTKKKYLEATGSYACASIADPSYEPPEWSKNLLEDNIPY